MGCRICRLNSQNSHPWDREVIQGESHPVIVPVKALGISWCHQDSSARGTARQGESLLLALGPKAARCTGYWGFSGLRAAPSWQPAGSGALYYPPLTELHLATITEAKKSSRWNLSQARTFTSAPETPGWEPVSHAQTCGSHSCELTHGWYLKQQSCCDL